MTVAEMVNSVLMKLDKSSAFAVAAFDNTDILYWLNIGQDTLLKGKVFGNDKNPSAYGQGLKRMEDISPLVIYTPEFPYVAGGTVFKAHNYHPNVAVLKIKGNMDDYLYYVGADVHIVDPNAPTSTLPQESILVEESVIGKLISTPYNKPVLRNCYIYLKEGEVNVIYDPFATLDSIYVSYVKKPKRLVLATPGVGETNESEMPEHTHDEIVDLTVFLMLENIESQRMQTQFVTINSKE